MEDAYKRACEEGSKEVFLARMNLVGFHEAGKTSLAKRLMGKDFDANVKSTEGIALHCIKSTFDKEKLMGDHWKEREITTDDLDAELIEQIKLNQGVQEDEIQDYNVIPPVSGTIIYSRTPLNPQKVKKEQVVKSATFEATKREELTEIKINARIKEKLASADMNNPPEKTSTQQPFTLRLWDLGGQNEFLTTHHLFLDVEATTVIVMDITMDFNKKFVIGDKDLKLKQSNPTSPKEILHYWLNSLEEEAEEKEEKEKRKFHPKVFIVLTHIDEITPEKREGEINSYGRKIMDSLDGKDYARFLTEIVAVDNKTGDRESFDKLRESLFKSFSKQGSWKREVPTKWIQFQADITAEKEKANKYLTLDKLKEMGANIGMGEKDIESFIQLHRLVGTFLHFDDNLQPSDENDSLVKLKDYIITDPQWLVDRCKEVITHPDFLYEKHLTKVVKDLMRGTVTEDGLKTIWDEDALPFLTKLLLAYDIFIPIADAKATGKQYLIPCMLPMESDYQTGEISITTTILYSGIHRAGCGQWFQMGKFSKLLAALHRKENWKMSLDPFPSYDHVSFTKGKMHLQLTLEENSNFQADMYCCTTDIEDENLGKILQETRDFLYKKAQHIIIENEEDLQTFCEYHFFEEEGLRIILSDEKRNGLKCPCHNKNLSEDDRRRFIRNIREL